MAKDVLDRLPPYNEAAESGVLGSILIDPYRMDEVAGIVSPADFYVDSNECLFGHLTAMRNEGAAVDAVTLLKRLEAVGDAARVGGHARLLELAQSVAAVSHATNYARIVAEQSRRRKIILAASEMLRDGYDQGKPIDEVVSDCEAALQKIPSGEYDGEPIAFFQALQDACEMVDEIAKHQRQSGMMIGLDTFDMQVGGLFPGELTILAARPSIGKTSLALQVAQHVATKGNRVYFASLEMRNTELALRILCGQSAVSMARVRSGKVGPADFSDIAAAGTSLSGLPITLHDRAGLSMQDIRRACRRIKAKDGLDLVVVDYLQRITPADRRVERHLQVGQITWDLKALALELQVPVLCLCQLGRAAEARDKAGKVIEPQLSHLKESGDIEQDADMVLLLHRQQRAADAVMILAKNRQGEQARFNLTWIADQTRFACRQEYESHSEFDGYGNDF